MTLIVMFVLLFVLLIAGAPVAVALGMSSLFFIATSGMPNLVVLHNMVNGINSFPLIAVPFFILAGHLMNTAGITHKIFTFARATVGWMYGGLGHVNVGVAVTVPGGLMTVVVKDADVKSMRQISGEIKAMAARAREGKVKPEDVVAIREKSRTQTRIQYALQLAQGQSIVDWVEVDASKMRGVFKRVPDRSDLPPDINESLVVELYSK